MSFTIILVIWQDALLALALKLQHWIFARARTEIPLPVSPNLVHTVGIYAKSENGILFLWCDLLFLLSLQERQERTEYEIP